MAEPHPDRAGLDSDPDPVSENLAALSELAAAGVEVDGEIQVAESTWVIYGHTSYDGEIAMQAPAGRERSDGLAFQAAHHSNVRTSAKSDRGAVSRLVGREALELQLVNQS